MDIKEEWTKIIIYLSVLIIISAVIIGYVLFFNFKKCENEDCFFGSLQGCKKSYWIREDNLSTWLYQIESPVSTKSCKVKVKLLKIKEGSILNEDLEGEIMYCNLIRNEIKYPEKDLSKCTGILKEKIQEIIIQRIHNYILENMEDIKKSF